MVYMNIEMIYYYIDYSYLSDNTKKFLKKSQRHILKLNEMIKEREGE
jgi:hypothetical protein